LLEEPEVHQHPGAIRQSARAILAAVRRQIQVMLTTHSLELIDALLAESSAEDLAQLSLYRVQLQNGVLTSSRLAGPDIAFSRSEIEDDLR
jgi:predicted ATPase